MQMRLKRKKINEEVKSARGIFFLPSSSSAHHRFIHSDVVSLFMTTLDQCDLFSLPFKTLTFSKAIEIHKESARAHSV